VLQYSRHETIEHALRVARPAVGVGDLKKVVALARTIEEDGLYGT